MTDEEINRAVAEHLGWKWCDHPDTLEKTKGWTLPHFVLNPAGELVSPHSVPDYAGDLNAMHEAENSGITPANSEDYSCHLAIAMDEADDFLWAATARQRAEAFLLTVGKWKGEA